MFVEHLALPALRRGRKDALFDAVLVLDKSLTKWSSHLTSLCRTLVRQRRMRTLYALQIFMKDYVRAAMTCVSHFYEANAQSYADFVERRQHLTEARRHLEVYLQEGMWREESSVASLVGAAPPERVERLVMAPREVSKWDPCHCNESL